MESESHVANCAGKSVQKEKLSEEIEKYKPAMYV